MTAMKPKSRTILFTILATLATVLVLQNVRATDVRFIVWEFTIPLALLVLIAFAAGWAAAWIWRRR